MWTAFASNLGTILAREPNGFDNQSGFLKACNQDPVLTRVKLVAETLGLRSGRLPGWWIPSRLGRMERQIPRYRPGFLARRSTGFGSHDKALRFR